MRTVTLGLLLAALVLIRGFLSPVEAAASSHSPDSGLLLSRLDEKAQARVRQIYLQLPLSFEANQGQMNKQVRFLSRGSGYGLFLTPSEAVLVLTPPEGQRGTVLRMKLVGANPAPRVVGLGELRGRSHYLKGSDPKQWRTHVPRYAKVRYEGVYPGIDLVYYGNQRQLEYDLIVAPGADPKAIRLAFEGIQRLRLGKEGELLLQTGGGEIWLQKPRIYQEVGGVKRTVGGRYILKDKNQVGFAVATYNVTQPLVIDPVLRYSTY